VSPTICLALAFGASLEKNCQKEIVQMSEICFFERNYGRILAVAAFAFVAVAKLFSA
jgi:hypothetical protein